MGGADSASTGGVKVLADWHWNSRLADFEMKRVKVVCSYTFPNRRCLEIQEGPQLAVHF